MEKTQPDTADYSELASIRPKVKCPVCNRTVFDGVAIKGRVTLLLARGAVTKCHCKTFVAVPSGYLPLSQ